MKTLLIISAFFVTCASCTKNTSTPISNNKLSFTPDSPVSYEPVLAWKCIGGDTVFNDTLFMQPHSIWFEQKTEMRKYVFSYGIWHHNEWVCTANDAAVIYNLSFTNEDCRTTYFKRIK